jgi:hypothetical protein
MTKRPKKKLLKAVGLPRKSDQVRSHRDLDDDLDSAANGVKKAPLPFTCVEECLITLTDSIANLGYALNELENKVQLVSTPSLQGPGAPEEIGKEEPKSPLEYRLNGLNNNIMVLVAQAQRLLSNLRC